MELIFENWRRFKVQQDMYKVDYSTILVETKNVNMSLKQLIRERKNNNISTKKYLQILYESMLRDLKELNEYVNSEEGKRVLLEAAPPAPTAPAAAKPGLFGSIGGLLDKGIAWVKSKIMSLITKAINFVTTSKDGNPNAAGKVLKYISDLNEKLKKHPKLYTFIKVTITGITITLLGKFIIAKLALSATSAVVAGGAASGAAAVAKDAVKNAAKDAAEAGAGEALESLPTPTIPEEAKEMARSLKPLCEGTPEAEQFVDSVVKGTATPEQAVRAVRKASKAVAAAAPAAGVDPAEITAPLENAAKSLETSPGLTGAGKLPSGVRGVNPDAMDIGDMQADAAAKAGKAAGGAVTDTTASAGTDSTPSAAASPSASSPSAAGSETTGTGTTQTATGASAESPSATSSGQQGASSQAGSTSSASAAAAAVSEPAEISTPWKFKAADIAEKLAQKDLGEIKSKFQQALSSVPADQQTSTFKAMAEYAAKDPKKMALFMKFSFMDQDQGFSAIDKLVQNGSLKMPDFSKAASPWQAEQDWKTITVRNLIKIGDAMVKATSK